MHEIVIFVIPNE